MTTAEKAALWMEQLAADDSHGYDQDARWGPDYDCSAAVITAYQQAGAPVKEHGATWTGNMRDKFLECGFEDVTAMINLSTGAGLIRGDVLLRHNDKTGNGHTAIYLGGGKIAHASINEMGTAHGGKPGDQTGQEICVRSYYNSPWNYVLRLTAAGNAPDETEPKFELSFRLLKYGSAGEDVRALQRLLKGAGFDIGRYGADGEFGADTLNAVKGFQKSKLIEADGEAGPETMARLLGLK